MADDQTNINRSRHVIDAHSRSQSVQRDPPVPQDDHARRKLKRVDKRMGRQNDTPASLNLTADDL
ncbi:MAG: hypothetical protein ACRD1H_11930 [Vicinamibacterales bacterium]